MEYQSLVELLDGFWSTPWDGLTYDQQRAWSFATTNCRNGYGETWDSMPIKRRKTLAALDDEAHGPEAKEELIGWSDLTMHANLWFRRANIKPDEAAKLLCRIDPLSDDEPEKVFVDDDKATPDRYRILKRAFEDAVEADAKSRTLLDWRDLAEREGLRYHRWIDEYEAASWLVASIGAVSYEPQILQQFQPSTVESPSGTIEGAGLKIQAIPAVDRNRILASFPAPPGVTEKRWSKTLGDPPKWLVFARVCKGKASISALWNPAKFAMAYCDKDHMTMQNLTVIMRRDFPGWLPEWEQYTDSFK